MSSSLEQLAQLFKQFPGIGARQAKRFVYFLLQQDKQFIERLVRYLDEARTQTHQCRESFQFFSSDDAAETLAPLVRNVSRTKTKLMIVTKDLDLENIEAMNVYDGQYFVLGGYVPMIAENVEQFVRINPLVSLVEKRITEDGLQEIIFATPANPEGDHTRDYLVEKLTPLANQHGVTLTTLGRGLSMGSELEYIDSATFGQALDGRK